MTDRQVRQIYTIGHSDHRIERFLVLLARHHIDAVADVRSSPRSSFNPQYNRDELSESLGAAEIPYVFMGEELGARRREKECFVHGKARYDLIAKLPAFNEGLRRLNDGASRYRIALLCAEKDPLTCHRAVLICRHLRPLDLTISHIRHDGQLESHAELENRMLKAVKVDGKDLLHSHDEAVEHAYDLLGEKIAYVKNGEPRDEKD